MDLNLRARRILQAVISEYISTGEAVGSRTVTKRPGINLSAATVRNVMSDLGEVGLLRQPHTSSGRVPTDRGLRYFVDSMLRVRSLTAAEKEAIRGRLEGREVELPAVMRGTSRVLSELSRHAALVLAPRLETDVVEHLQFIPLRSGEILAIIVTKSGLVQNRLVGGGMTFRPGELDRVHNYVNELVGGLTFDEMRARVRDELERTRDTLDAFLTEGLRLGALAVAGATAPELFVEGQSNLVGPVADAERLKGLLRALEEKTLVEKLFEVTASAPGVRVFIGAELEHDGLADCSVVTAGYGPEEQPLGTLGVIGPVHMNYSKVIPLVDFTAEMVSDALRRHARD